MTEHDSAGLARGWIEAWISMDIDWLRIENGTIREVRSFYDTSRIREVLSESEQRMLDSSH